MIIRNIKFTGLLLLLGIMVPVAGSLSANTAAGQAVDDGAVKPVFRTGMVPGGRIDLDTSVFRARYVFDQSEGGTVSEIMTQQAPGFGWATDLSDLVLIREHRDEYSTQLTYQQELKGVPVEGRYVKLSLDREGRPTMISSGYTPLAAPDDISPVPVQSADRAESVALAAFAADGGRTTEPKLVFTAEKKPRLAWKVVVWPEDKPAEWVVFVSAENARVIASYDEAIKLRGAGPVDPSVHKSPRVLLPGNRPSARNTRHESPSRQLISGTGFVFDPDPLSTAGAPYGAPYVDSNDAAVPELEAEKKLVTLSDISLNGAGQYVLEGPFAKIVGVNQLGTTTYTPPAPFSPDGFQFSRSDDGFEAVNVYYHVDKSQRYVQSLGVTDRRNAPFRVNPLGLTSDDSFYFPSADMIVLGAGGVDDGEDASIIWHEYAHALLDDISPGLFSSKEGQAYHEGWADYWAASYARFLFESGATIRSDWDRMFRWDSGDGVIWAGRVLDDFDHYPEGVCTAQTNAGVCDIHDDGRLWATTMLEVYTELGRETTDILSLRSHQYLSPPLTFSDAGQAVIQADLDYFSGAHLDVLIRILGDRGLVDTQVLGPSIIHTPLGWTEDVAGTQTISADIIGVSDPVMDVLLFYQIDNGAWVSQPLQAGNGNAYEGGFGLPATPGTVSYYLQASDTGSRTSLLPDNAPAATFQFNVGPDAEPPSIAHVPIQNVSLVAWPPSVTAEVTDNLGVSGVRVTYRIESTTAEELAAGSFDLASSGNLLPTDAQWSGVFPVQVSVLEVNALVSYSITATDGAVSRNSSSTPALGDFSFRVESTGVISVNDFDGQPANATFTGSFEQGAPNFGLQTTYSGSGVAGTSLGTAYPAQAGVSTLELPPINLTGVGDPLLVFWHWYDMEHDGSADPSAGNGLLFDGGNIKISTDGGINWEILTPENGYRGSIVTNQQNPLSGEPAFGGYSFGWRQEIAALPEAPDVRIRFNFGTDGDNSQVARWFAGWFLDDIQVTTIRPPDSGVPQALLLPDSPVTLSVDEVSPTIELRLNDDNGVADVFADYTFTNSSTAGTNSPKTGTIRLEMDPVRKSFFRGTFDFVTDPKPSDRLTYQIRAIDHSGNESTFDDGAGVPFQIDYRLIDEQLVSVSVASSGLWRPAGAGWVADEASNGPGQTGQPVQSDQTGLLVSSVNLIPIDLPVNGDVTNLVLQHSFRLFDNMGGNVKISDDGGRSWAVLEPEGGYQTTLDLPEEHPMAGESGLVGDESNPISTVFPLDAYVGKQVNIRVDFATTRAFFAGERWTIDRIDYIRSTGDELFTIDRKFALHPNYPNPFTGTTRIGFTLDKAESISLELYDITGRRVQTILTGFFEAGSYERSLDARGLAGGTYILSLRGEGHSDDRPIALYR